MLVRNKRVLAIVVGSLLSISHFAYGANTEKTGEQEIFTSLATFEKAVAADKTVSRKAVTFKKQNLKMAGFIFSPAGLDESKKHPAIVVTHPGGGSKEQAASLYAYRLAQLGYVALAFDASYQGESEGEPRQLEDPWSRVEDIRSAVDYLTTLSFVDLEKIGALGVCAGGGYTLNASATDHRIKAVAVASSVDFGHSVRNGWRNKGTVAEQLKLLEDVAAARTAEANGAAPKLVPYVPDTTAGVTEPDMVEASEYYRLANRWQTPNSPNRFLQRSFDKLLAFNAFDPIKTMLTQPVLFIVGSEAGSKWQSEEAFKLAKGQKELFVVKGGTHMSLYDRDVGKAMPKLKEFYGKHIKPTTNLATK